MIVENTKKIYKAKIDKIEKTAGSTWFVSIDCGKNTKITAGQFISVYCENLTLRRPFSVFSDDNGRIGILVKERGKGTDYIKSLKAGDFIDITGPFGNGFNIAKNKKSLLIGAGIGCAPVSFLKSILDKNNTKNFFICGFLNKNEIPSNINVDKIYTDDGSSGGKGSVLDHAENVIKEYKPEIIYACGPAVVLKTISEIAVKYSIPVQIAMEKIMACAVGVCRGCVINVIKDGKTLNKTVCKDGPVFLGSEVVWQ